MEVEPEEPEETLAGGVVGGVGTKHVDDAIDSKFIGARRGDMVMED